MTSRAPRLMAGIPATNNSLYRKVRFNVGDPVVFIESPDGPPIFILRDIEMERARVANPTFRVICPADFTPEGGLSGDRETATAQAAAECLRQEGVTTVTADRTLPLIFAHILESAGITVTCDPAYGVIDRRSKDETEVGHLRAAQSMTEDVMNMACQVVARADVDSAGVLQYDGAALTSERVRGLIDIYLLERDYSNPACIVAGGPDGGDCHERGSGPLRTGEPVIIDIFPRSRATLYNGDCTRCVVHGTVSDEVQRMHAAVVEAKAAAIAAVRTGVTGEAVNDAAAAVIVAHGYSMGLPGPDAPDTHCAMTHGTGHGVGLDVHEPPLLDTGGPPLVAGDILTVEPGLYCPAIGGIRIEDMIVVRDGGSENFNTLPEGLDWR